MKKLFLFFKNAGALKSTFITTILAAVPLMIVFMFVTMPGVEQRIKNNKKTVVQTATDSVFKILDYYHQKEVAKELTTEQAQNMAAETIKNLRYNENEYFWINDTDPKMIMHPIKSDLNGKDLSKMADPTGKKLFVEMVQVTKASPTKAGFVDYMWPKPGLDKPQPKTSYVRLYPEWNWIVGNGVYSDDVAAEITKVRNENMRWFVLATFIAIIISAIGAAKQFFKVILPIQSVVSSLEKETDYFLTAAQSLSTSSTELNSTGEMQSKSVEQTTTVIDNINNMINQTAESAKQSSDLAIQTKDVIENSLQSLESVNSNMHDIDLAKNKLQEAVVNNMKKMEEVVKIINQVSDKTKVIDEIVFQTKLLSFNASVEAARAGEAGKGFAVVAEEVGNLAQMSGNASLEIHRIVTLSNEQVISLMNSIKNNLNDVIKNVASAVEEGTKNSTNSLNLLNSVLDLATQSSQMATNISQASDAQSKESQIAFQGLKSIEQSSFAMNSVVHKTDQISTNLLTKSKELNKLSNNLVEIVDSKSKKVA